MKPLRFPDVLTHPADDFLFWNFLLWLKSRTCTNTRCRSWHLNTSCTADYSRGLHSRYRSAFESPRSPARSRGITYRPSVWGRISLLVSLFWTGATVLNYADRHLWDARAHTHTQANINALTETRSPTSRQAHRVLDIKDGLLLILRIKKKIFKNLFNINLWDVF